MLTRIYGLAFDTKEELEAYSLQQEEAKKRDHRILGQQLNLFIFSPLVGPGLPLWTPRGTILRTEIDTFVQTLRKKYNYGRVTIPHFTTEFIKINTRGLIYREFCIADDCPHIPTSSQLIVELIRLVRQQ
jgi:threonyl-tRNA synthetase